MKQINVIIGKIVDKLYLVLAFFLVLFAVLVTIARALTPVFKHYNQDIAMWAETFLHKPVAIEQVKAGWNGFHPVLDLHNVSILNETKNKTIFKLKDLQISLNLFKSLLERKVVINRLFVNGTYIAISQNENKQWSVKGFSSTTDKGEGLQGLITWILSQPQLVLQNINLQIKLPKYKPYLLHNLNLMLSNTSSRHHLQGQAYLATAKKSPIDIIINLDGNANQVKSLQGNFYVKAKKVFFNHLLSNHTFYGFKYKQGTFSLNLWGEWKNHEVDNVQAKINFDDVDLQSHISTNNALYINKLKADLFWHRLSNKGWELSSDKISLNLNHKLSHTTKFGIWIFHPVTGFDKQLIEVNAINLYDLNLLLSQSTLLPNNFRKTWKDFSPSGQLKNIQFFHIGNFKKLNRYHVTADLENLQWNNVKKIPGFSRLNGHLNMTDKAGALTVSSQDATFVDNTLFRNSISLTRLTGLLQWQRDGNAWQVYASNINAVTPEINLMANMNLKLPLNTKEPFIRLFGTYQAHNLSKVKDYFPAKIMPKGVVSWLDKAFIKGDSAQGSVLLFGPLKQFPFIKNNGQFIVDSDLNNVELNYLSTWPNIKNLSGNLVFTKRLMNFTTSEGSIAEQTISRLTATIPNFASHPQSRLYVKGEIALHDLNNAKQFVLHSPLQNSVGKSLRPFKMQGKGSLDLNLNIPLEFGKTITKGKLILPDNTLSIPNWNLQFENIKGTLSFTDDGLSTKQLKAKFYGEPTTVNIQTLYNNKLRITRFKIHTKVHLADVKKYFSIKDHGFITGLTPLNVTLDIPVKGENHFRAESNLQGIQINLPEPYHKNKQTTHALQIDSDFSNTIAPIVSINYHDLVMANLAYSKINGKLVFSRANIHLGAGSSKLPAEPGVFINGYLKDFSWSNWKKVLLPYLQPEIENKKKEKADNKNLKQISLKINNLNAFSQHLSEVSLLIQPEFDSWMIAINSNRISGKLTIPLAYKHKTTIGYFKKLDLKFPKSNRHKSIDTWDPRSMVPVNLSADNFNYNNNAYGEVQLAAAPIKDGLQISTLKVHNSLYTLDAKGTWLRINKKDRSEFSGVLTADNLGELLKRENFTTHIYKGKGSVNFKLAWPDEPSSFQTKDLQGNISAKFTNGAITGLDKETNKKIGLGKIINALSLSNLVKHLTLNFDKAGYDFSQMRGDLNLHNGILKTNNTYLNGSVAELYIAGELGLRKQTYDLLVTINPYITSSLPILATIVGGPVAGVATWAVSKLARAGVKKAVVYQYHLGGTWNDPIVKNVLATKAQANSQNKE